MHTDGSGSFGEFDDFTGKEPEAISRFIAEISTNYVYIQGTAVRAIAPEYKQLPNGLIVPKAIAQGPAPLDQMLIYLTAEEIFGRKVRYEYVIGELRTLPSENVLSWVAEIMARLRTPSVQRSEVDHHYANLWFNGETLKRVLNLLRDRTRGLIVPQALLAIAQQAMFYCGDSVLRGIEPGNLVAALLVGADHLVGREPETDTILSKVPGDLGRELIANQVFNAEVDEAHYIARFIRTWLQLPSEKMGTKEIVDVEAEYQNATGVSLRDFLALGLTLWFLSVTHNSSIPPSLLNSLEWGPSRTGPPLSLISADIPNLRAETRKESLKATTHWSFDTFGRYPLIRGFSGNIIVIDPDLLIKRIFGWLPIYDVQEGLSNKGKSGRKTFSRVLTCIRRLAEHYTAEVLDSIASGSSISQRVYHDKDLNAAYAGHGIKIADAAIDYGDAWIVIEVTTAQLRRDSVSGKTDEAFVADLEKLIEEVRQINSTIESIRANEQLLTKLDRSKEGKKYYPLLVLTEGFPVNPVTLTLLRERVAEEDLLTSSDVMPLEIADIVELEMVEGIQEEGGPSLREILDRKSTANLWRMQLRDFILVELRLTPKRPRRVTELFKFGFRELLSRVNPALANVELPGDD